MEGKPDISIIGPGKVGTAIGVLATEAGYRVVAVAGRTAEHVEAAAARIGHGAKVAAPAKAAAAGRIVLLTVTDEAIEPLGRKLADDGAFGKGAVVAHCCGALSSGILQPAKTLCGCAIGSMHPLQTFPTVAAAVAKLPGAWCFVEGDDVAAEALMQLAVAIGGKTVRIDPAGKALYHASAVMACNYLAALMDASLAMAENAGIDRKTALEALGPLVEATIDNITAMGPAEALTGPIARGDCRTVARHLQALDDCPAELANFYRAAGAWAANLAKRKGTIDNTKAQALRELLNPTDLKE